MDMKRLIEIFEAYGSKPELWPLEERESVNRFLELSPDAEEYRIKQYKLDLALDDLARGELARGELIEDNLQIPDLNTLRLNILAKIEIDHVTQHATQTDRLLNWFFPEKPKALWQPAFAAALPITIGIFLGSHIALLETDDHWDQTFYLNAFSNMSSLSDLDSEVPNSVEMGND